MAACTGLELHPEKTKIVYCKDRKRRQPYDGPCSFTFLGFTHIQGKTRDGHRLPGSGEVSAADHR
ncbi:MAG TPA: hypothetical protein VN969_37020 [Streptosporangiaceae bacterium]|jgi:RNA-directed DNA polymerase|nr:hypothetical protein [Streptosporangiaceae bacterium]